MECMNVVIEITRRCQLECRHCLRGDAEDLDFDPETFRKFIKANKVTFISTLVFSGGEPSLVPHLINSCIDILEQEKVELGSFYIATNNVEITDEFLKVLLRLYLTSCERDMCQVEISNDQFHYDGLRDSPLLAFRFTGEKFTKEGRGMRLEHFVAQGRAATFTGREIKQTDLEIEDGRIETEIYLNCKGEMYSNCDMSYEVQDEKELNYLGHCTHKIKVKSGRYNKKAHEYSNA